VTSKKPGEQVRYDSCRASCIGRIHGGHRRWLFAFLAACYELTLISFFCFILLLFVANKFLSFFISIRGVTVSCISRNRINKTRLDAFCKYISTDRPLCRLTCSEVEGMAAYSVWLSRHTLFFDFAGDAGWIAKRTGR